MHLFGRKPKAHRVVVLQLGEEAQGLFFFALCDCGWNIPPRNTKEEAFADAYGHDANVVKDVEPVAVTNVEFSREDGDDHFAKPSY